MENVDAVVFDLDGVLLDSEKDLNWLYRVLEKTLKNYHIYPSQENIMKIHPINVYNFEKTTEEFKINFEEFWSTRNSFYIQEKKKAMKNREIEPFIDINSLYDLKGKYTIGILSNSPQEIVDFFIEEFNYKDLFDCGIGRGSKVEDYTRLKPNPFLFEKLKTCIKKKNMIYVGDSYIDRKFAENTGIKFLFLSRNGRHKCYSNLWDIVWYILNY